MDSASPLRRRTVVAGTLWAAPAALTTIPAPAFAASSPLCTPDPNYSNATVSFRDPRDDAEATAFGVIIDAQSRMTPDSALSGPFEVTIAWTQSTSCADGISPDTGIRGLTATAAPRPGAQPPTVTTDFTPGTSQATASIDLYDPNVFEDVMRGQVLLEFSWPNRRARLPTCHGTMHVNVTVSYLSDCGPTSATFSTEATYGYDSGVA